MKHPVPVLIIGPSGVGKNAVIDRILPLFPDLQPYKTTTSRPTRPGETKYHFVSNERFDQLIETGAMLEWEETHDNKYGTQRQHIMEIIDAGKYPVPLSAVDYRGALTYLEEFPGTLVVFLACESIEVLEKRIRANRPETSDEEIAIRLETARNELAAIDQFTHIVVNKEGELDTTVEEVAAIIKRELGLERKGGQ